MITDRAADRRVRGTPALTVPHISIVPEKNDFRLPAPPPPLSPAPVADRYRFGGRPRHGGPHGTRRRRR